MESLKSLVPKILIVAGSLCLVASIGYEVLRYPWYTLDSGNAGTLSDPLPPDFDYIDFKDVRDSVLYETPEDPYIILPGVENSTEPEPSQTAEEREAVAESPFDAASIYVLLGVVKIPRLGVSENLFEGSSGQMKHGVGHVEGTSLPGQPGNAVIAGHRVSTLGKQPFRYLDLLENGDTITVNFDSAIFTYEVFDKLIVSKYDVWVLEPLESETYVLTLLTCDPVISATSRENRLIIRARLLAEE